MIQTPQRTTLDPKFERVTAQEASSFRCERRTCDTFTDEHPWHFHPAFELTWIVRSSGTRYVGDSVERYEPGDLVLCGPNLPHCWRDDMQTVKGRGPEWIISQFEPANFGIGFLEVQEARAIRALLDESRFGLVFHHSAVPAVGTLLRRLVGRAGMSRLLGLIEILERLAHSPRTALAAPSYYHSNHIDDDLIKRLEVVHSYLSERLSQQISQRVIARRSGMSASAFSKFYRAATGRTFLSQVKLLRINEACRLLVCSDDNITDIALACGYQHTSHFDQHFRELKGLSPRDYRREMLKLTREAPRLPISQTPSRKITVKN